MEFVQMYRGYAITKRVGGVCPMYFAKDSYGIPIKVSNTLKELKDYLKALPRFDSTDSRDTLIRPTERD